MLAYDGAPEIESLNFGVPTYCEGLVYYEQVKRRASELHMIAPSLICPADLTGKIAA